MDKISSDWLENYRINLGGIYKTIFISELKNYNIFDCTCDEIIVNKKNEISSISLDVHLDFLVACDSDSESIGNLINTINDDIMQVLKKYIVNRKTFRITHKGDNPILSEGLFLKFEYNMDEKHEALVWFKYLYE